MTSPYPAAHNLFPSQAVSVLLQFVYLQILDVLTTVAFLDRHVAEANPALRLLLHGAHSPLGVLLLAKLLAFALAAVCLSTGRVRVLARANLFFAALIIWNVLALIAAA